MEKQAVFFFMVMMCGLLLGGAGVGQAQSWTEYDKITASDGANDDYFGCTVSLYGDYCLAGALLDDDNGSESGSAYLFKRSGVVWTEQAKLTASDGSAGDHFGRSVSLYGDYALVGAGDDNIPTNLGSAYIFKRDGTTWTQQAKLVASDGAAGDAFGFSVSLSGDYALVGAVADDGYRGSAYIFKRDDTNWVQQAKLTASDADIADHFGLSVSLDDDYALVGAFADDDLGISSGSAYIFVRNGTTWSQQAKLLASDGDMGDHFGCSTSLYGDYALVGAYSDNDKGISSGSAYIFVRSGTTWSQQAKLLASDGASGDYFGISVSLFCDYALVGSHQDDDQENNSGSAYIFKRDGTAWLQQPKLTASDGAEGDYFGGSVSLDGDYILVGAYGVNDMGRHSGAAYIFGRCPAADLNGDCFVDLLDLSVLTRLWMKGYE